MKLTPVPICAKPIHDAHAFALLLFFFIGVALPVHWHTVLIWSLMFAVLAYQQGVTIGTLCRYCVFALALSWSVGFWNIAFVAERDSDTITRATGIFLRVGSMTWVALMSSKMLNLRDVVSTGLQRRWLPLNMAYALQLGFGAIELFRAETRRIMLSAHLRGLTWRQKFLQWIPILVFALRHATRSAMSLRARGLREGMAQKTFYYDYQATTAQKRWAWIWLVCFLIASFFSEWLALL